MLRPLRFLSLCLRLELALLCVAFANGALGSRVVNGRVTGKTDLWERQSSPFTGSTDLGFPVLLPSSAGYANASRPFNLRFDFQPAAIAFPSTIQEVSEIVKLGHQSNHQVVARSGGHSYIANGLGGKNGVIVIDMSNFKAIQYDSSTGSATIGVGNRIGDIITGLSQFGRGMPHGTCTYIGLGGHAAFGGYGFTSRMWGLTLDVILSMDLVLANGTIITASETENSDIFWAMRGAAPSFGITTSITFKTFPAPPSATIFSFNWHLSPSQAAQALTAYQSFSLTETPSILTTEVVLTPASVVGNVSIGVSGGWYGPPEKLNSTLKPLLDRMPLPPRTQSFDTGDYLHSAINLAGGSVDTTVPDTTDTFYAKSLMVMQSAPLREKAIEAFMNFIANEGVTTPVGWFFEIELFGGKGSVVNNLKPDATAFPHRDVLLTFQLYASAPRSLPPYPEAGFQFVEGAANAILQNSPPNWPHGAYANYLDDRLVNWQQQYYAGNYARLRKIKDMVDPKETFSFPLSIQE